jgi:hypothetical protein
LPLSTFTCTRIPGRSEDCSHYCNQRICVGRERSWPSGGPGEEDRTIEGRVRVRVCYRRLWSVVPGQGPGPVLMLPLCSGHDRAFVGDIVHMTARFGTEGSVVRIHSPRPILRKSSEIFRVQSGRSLGFNAQIGSREPSAPYFKRWPSVELCDISSGWFSPRTRRPKDRAQTLMLTLC